MSQDATAPSVVIFTVPTHSEACEAIERLLCVEPGGLAFKGNRAIADNPDEFWHDGAFVMPVSEFVERFVNFPFENGLRAGKEQKSMSVLQTIPRAIARMFKGNDPEKVKAYRQACKEYATLPEITERIKSLNAKLAEVEVKIKAGELTTAARVDLDHQIHVWTREQGRLRNEVAIVLRDYHPDQELVTQRAQLLALRRAAGKRKAEAAKVVASCRESLARAKQAGERSPYGGGNWTTGQSAEAKRQADEKSRRLKYAEEDLSDAEEELLDAERVCIETQEQYDALRAQMLLPVEI